MTLPYISVEDAETYFGTRLHADAWDDAVSDDQTKAIYTASRMIQRLNFIIHPDDMDPLPDEIGFAAAELALALLDGVDPETEFESLTMTSQAYANVRSSYDRQTLPENIVAGVPSAMAWRYLSPYLADPREVDLARVS